MRLALIAAALILPSIAEARPLTRAECADGAKAITSASEAMAHLGGVVLKRSTAELGLRGEGDLRAAAERADRVRTKMAPVTLEYAQALEDLAYQLKVCAR